jgi:hypothetical protein
VTSRNPSLTFSCTQAAAAYGASEELKGSASVCFNKQPARPTVAVAARADGIALALSCCMYIMCLYKHITLNQVSERVRYTYCV